MVRDSEGRFEFQILDSRGNPLPEYPYRKPGNESSSTTEIYLQVPDAASDQTFSIRIQKANYRGISTFFFQPKYDGIPDATGQALRASQDVLEFSEMGLKNVQGTGIAYHKMKFEKLPPGVDEDENPDEFGTIQIKLFPISNKFLPAPNLLKKGVQNAHEIKNRKRPFSSIASGATGRGSSASSASITPSSSNSVTRHQSSSVTRHQNRPVVIADGAMTHNVGIGELCYTMVPDRTVTSIGGSYRVVFHYRSKEALRLLGVVPGPRNGGLLLPVAANASEKESYKFLRDVKRVEKERLLEKMKERMKKEMVKKKRAERERAERERDEFERVRKQKLAVPAKGKKVEHLVIEDDDEVEDVDSDEEALLKQLTDTMTARKLN